jgi:cytochrome P450
MKQNPPVADGSSPVVNHLFQFRNNTYKFLEKNCRSKGPVFSFSLLSRKYYVFNHPDFIRHVLVDNVKNYSRIRQYSIMEELLGKGLITTEGEEWKRRRRVAQPAFHKEKLELLIQKMEAAVNGLMHVLDYESLGEIDLDREMNHITLTVLSKSIIQADLDEEYQAVKQNLNEAWKYISQKRFRSVKWLNKLPGKTKSNGRKAIASLHQTMLSIIEGRRASGKVDSDLLSMLMESTDEETGNKLTDKELLGELMTLFVAGHDTTAIALTWAFYLICRHPDIEAKILDEINTKWTGESLTMKALQEFRYTKMVIQEVLRLYPPVWTFGRRSVKEDNIGGFYIPANAAVTMPALFIHRSPEFWERPDEFYPEHFSPENMTSQKKHAYFPFGGGQHLCIGEHFALMEMQLVLIHMFRKYKISLVSKEPAEMNLLITIRPKEIIHVNFEKRN